MSKEIISKLKLNTSVNRSMTYTIFIKNKPIVLSILFNKQSPALLYQVESNRSPIQTGEVLFSMHRNLENSRFCQTFLYLDSVEDDHCNFQNKFSGINRTYERDIFQFIKEKLDLHLVDYPRNSNNYILVMGWKVQGFENDLLFLFTQRKYYNNITRMNIIRTAGIQFYTPRGLEALERYHENSQNSIKKVSDVSFLRPGMYDPDAEDDEEVEEINSDLNSENIIESGD